jgi:hypothetical protein
VAQSVAAAALPAVKAWVQRVVIGMNVCPYTKDIGVSPAGMEKRGVTSGRIGKRLLLALHLYVTNLSITAASSTLEFTKLCVLVARRLYHRLYYCVT